MIDLIVEPRAVKTWEQFCRENPAYSIALDGYVTGAPKFDENGPYLNLNHHENVDRLATRSTCSQAYMHIKQYLFDKFRKNNEPIAQVYINDPDQDTSLAVWLLKNHSIIEKQNGLSIKKLLIEKLVDAEDKLDVTAGAYPFSDIDILERITWIFQPYTDARTAGKISSMNADEMKGIVDECCFRVDSYTEGKANTVKLDCRYETIGGGENWAMIKETGANARVKLFGDGIRAFISLIGKKDESNYAYTIGKISPFVPFPIEKLYAELNKIEGIDGNDKWGGSSIIGGSPRQRGSRIPPKELENIINGLLK